MKSLSILSLLFLLPHLGESAVPDTIPLHQYLFSEEILEQTRSGELRGVQPATQYSFIGEHRQALEFPSEVDLDWGFDTLTQADRDYYRTFAPRNAVQAILERSKEEQVVILNEAHDKVHHRTFARQLLQGLYDNGYRLFGLEALTNCQVQTWTECDSTLMQRGFPVRSPLSGPYVSEPQMGHLIRDAIAIGFTVFSYEQTGRDRDLNQAKNIQRMLDKHPGEKAFILCGWFHLLEQPNHGRTWMAQYLRELTGIDPFTIYQDILTERHSSPESPFMEIMHFEEPTVFLNQAGKWYNGHPDNERFDALIYHPRAKYRYNRPDWLWQNTDRQFVPIAGLGDEYPYLIKAFIKGEGIEGVPADIIEVAFANDPAVLILSPGTYTLQIDSKDGKDLERVLVVQE